MSKGKEGASAQMLDRVNVPNAPRARRPGSVGELPGHARPAAWIGYEGSGGAAGSSAPIMRMKFDTSAG